MMYILQIPETPPMFGCSHNTFFRGEGYHVDHHPARQHAETITDRGQQREVYLGHLWQVGSHADRGLREVTYISTVIIEDQKVSSLVVHKSRHM